MAVSLHPLLRPFKPSSDDRFDHIKAAHLLNRAGFGGTPDEIEKVMKLGPIDAVDWLMDFPDAPAEEQSETDVPDLSGIEGYARSFREMQRMMVGKTQEERQQIRQMMMQQNRQAVNTTIEWWMKRMIEGSYPLQEKLVL